MESTIIAIAAVLLLAVQTHRNYLMVQAAKRVHEPDIITVNVPAPELSIEVQPSPVTIESLIDYDRLESMILKVVEANKYVPVPMPQYPTPPSPYWQTPVVADGNINTVDDGHQTINETEINGVKGRIFPNR